MLKLRPRQHPLFVEENIHFRRSPPRLRLRFLLLLIATIAAAWAWQQTRADELDNVEAGQLLLTTKTGETLNSAINLDSRVHFQISGMMAHVGLTQQFRNDSTHWAEGVYVFPLPENAAVNRMRIIIGERIIEGKIKEKAEAKQIYQQAKAAGKQAGLVQQQRPNLFTTRVANIAPYETVTVELDYIQTVQYDSGNFSLRFPMTITPRFIPGKPLANTREDMTAGQAFISSALGWAVNTDQVPDASEITPWLNPQLPSDSDLINPIEITAELDLGMPLAAIESAYHAVISHREGDRYQLRLTKGKVAMQQDFVLNWQPLPGSAPQAAWFSEAVESEQYGLLMLMPPTQQTTALPREAIYVIDTSGSMDGVSIRQARKSLAYALQQLSPQDRFNIIAFNSTTHQLFPQAVLASRDNVARAAQYVSGLRSGGGTQMLPAVHAALADPVDEGGVRQVIFITDGAVGNEQALFTAIHQQLGNSRLFTVGIGSAPNAFFMRKAAQFGRGTYTYIGQVEEVEHKMRQLFSKLDSPVATNIQIEWPDHRPVEVYPQRIPDLYSGEPLLVAVKLDQVRGDVVVSGTLAGQDWQQRLHIDSAHNHQGVASLWAREKIASLLDEKTSGADASSIREQVLTVALRHQLVSPYTSFVAVEETISRPAEAKLKTSPILNLRPKGQGAQSFAFPQTATHGPQSLLWGIALLVMCLVLRTVLNREERYELV